MENRKEKIGKLRTSRVLWEPLETRILLSGTATDAFSSSAVDVLSSQGTVRYRTIPILHALNPNSSSSIDLSLQSSPAQSYFKALTMLRREVSVAVAVNAAASLNNSALSATLSVLGSYSGGESQIV